MRLRLPLALPAALLAPIVAGVPLARSASELTPLRWTDATPDAMVDDATARALAPNATEHAQAAAIATIAALADRARNDHARDALGRLLAAPTAGATPDTTETLSWIARVLRDRRIMLGATILSGFRGRAPARSSPKAPPAARVGLI